MKIHAISFLICAAFIAPGAADPITPGRIEKLPAAEQPAWKDYIARSKALADADASALQAEVAKAGLPAALKPPEGADFRYDRDPADAWNAGDEANQLADVVISYQAPCGGWSKHISYSPGPRRSGMQWTSQSEPGKPPHYLCTIDNGATVRQMQLLAAVWLASKREDCAGAFAKGLDYLLAAQFPNGGWPQVYPLEGGYHDDITYNDDAMIHVLELLQGIVAGQPQYGMVDDARRRKASEALQHGIGCLVASQLQHGGKKAVWCAQHDALTLAASPARKMEPASFSGVESAGILRFLMSLPKPSAEIVGAIESGLAWLDAAKVPGIGKAKKDGKTIFVQGGDDPKTYWARFYDLQTGKPIFPGRDGIIYPTFEALAEKNEVGYDYYSTRPGSILENGQKKWRKAQGPATKN